MPYQLHGIVSVLLLLARLVRDYLELEFQNAALPFPFSLEHVVDDFVLFCMLIGNDFLPCESHRCPTIVACRLLLPFHGSKGAASVPEASC